MRKITFMATTMLLAALASAGEMAYDYSNNLAIQVDQNQTGWTLYSGHITRFQCRAVLVFATTANRPDSSDIAKEVAVQVRVDRQQIWTATAEQWSHDEYIFVRFALDPQFHREMKNGLTLRVRAISAGTDQPFIMKYDLRGYTRLMNQSGESCQMELASKAREARRDEQYFNQRQSTADADYFL